MMGWDSIDREAAKIVREIDDEGEGHWLGFARVFASAIATSNDEALNQLIFPSPSPFLPLSKSD